MRPGGAGGLVEGASTSLGFSIAWSAPPAVDEILRAIVGAAPALDAPAEGAITFDFAELAEPLPYEPPAGFEWSFYQDRIVAYAGPTAFSFQDDASEVRVPLGAGPIVGRIHPSSLVDRRSLRLLLELTLAMALRARGLFHLHAAGVLREGTSILLSGESGAGKTTSALALVEAGWSYLSDDSVFLRDEDAPGSGRVCVAAQRRAFHVTAATLAAYPGLGALATPSETEPSKLRVSPEGALRGRFLDAAPPPTLLLFPKVHDAETSHAERVVDAVALGHLLMASTMLSVPGTPHTKAHLDLLRRLVEGAACYELRLGSDFLLSPARAVAGVIEPLVARARGGVVPSREP